MKLNQFVAKSHINEPLIRAVVRQSGGWEAFTDMADDITNHGVDGGFHGWIYHAETVPFAKRNKGQILALASTLADDLGESMLAMIAGFNCLKTTPEVIAEAIYNPRSSEQTQVFNALAWFAAEEVARSYCDCKD